ncbi:uncharacterized protein [Chironomus tepperi]|uniref:uncharacterized protein n=1 Tax=Chironomus tepperi TaxID=113505 RepID=UPI00391F1F7A
MYPLKTFFGYDLEIGGKVQAKLGMIWNGINMIFWLICWLVLLSLPELSWNSEFNRPQLNLDITIVIFSFEGFYYSSYYIYYALNEGIMNRCASQIGPAIIDKFTSMILYILMLIFLITSFDFGQSLILCITILGIIIIIWQAYGVMILLSIMENFEVSATQTTRYPRQ